jgi:hypothetical protein
VSCKHIFRVKTKLIPLLLGLSILLLSLVKHWRPLVKIYWLRMTLDVASRRPPLRVHWAQLQLQCVFACSFLHSTAILTIACARFAITHSTSKVPDLKTSRHASGSSLSPMAALDLLVTLASSIACRYSMANSAGVIVSDMQPLVCLVLYQSMLNVS